MTYLAASVPLIGMRLAQSEAANCRCRRSSAAATRCRSASSELLDANFWCSSLVSS